MIEQDSLRVAREWPAPPHADTSANAPPGEVAPGAQPDSPSLLSESPSLGAARELIAGWRGAARELGELASYPRVSLDPARSVGPGEGPWRLFVQRASVPDLQIAVIALSELIAEMPSP